MMPKRREETPSDDEDSAQLSSDDDAPAAAQWIDEDDLDGLVDSEEDEFAEHREDVLDEETVKKDLSSLPFGTLAKASSLLRNEPRGSDSDNNSDAYEDVDASEDESNVASSSKIRSDPHKRVKRADKHAPMEVSSKKPVSRRRLVVDVPKIERRDPRFSSLSGSFDDTKFSQSYSFITSLQESEVADLRSSLSRAQKLLVNSPAHLREERTEEVTRLVRALKRTESNVERAKRERRQREALSQAKRSEHEKQAAGKGSWHMKNSEKAQLLAEARFKDLAQEGKGAVRKAIAKRQLKVSQKEKRSRPGPHPSSKDGAQSFGERRSISQEHRNKRQKVV